MGLARPSVGGADGSWSRALGNFIQYLPPEVTHWVVALELPAHRTISRHLIPLLGSTTVFVLGETPPDLVQRSGVEFVDDPTVGFLEFAVNDGRSDHQGVDYHDALMSYAQWPTTRLRLCFDVWDDTFPLLFAEDPSDVKRRCGRTRERLGDDAQIIYRDSSELPGELAMDCTGSRWVEYSGLEDYDYMLPSGEVACCPRSVDGVIDVDGWLIGTLPFGLKYGRIQRGDLILRFTGGELTEVTGARHELVADLQRVVTAVPALRTVAEVGLGQSRAVPTAVPLCEPGYQWHERHDGLHLGLGAELPETLGSRRRTTNHHVDVVTATGSLDLDGTMWHRW